MVRVVLESKRYKSRDFEFFSCLLFFFRKTFFMSLMSLKFSFFVKLI